MKETFVALCKLWSFMSFCLWTGNYRKAVNTEKKIDEISKNHKVLNFIAMHLYPFFV